MLLNLKHHKVLWLTTAIMALIVSFAGIVNIGIYNKVVSKDLLPAVFAPDVLTLISSFLIIYLTFFKKSNYKAQIIILGILGYFFYNYGVYVIERIYNIFYFLYMGIFALSFWSIFYAIITLDKKIISNITLSKKVRYFSFALAMLQPLVFYPLWISQLIPLMQEGRKIEFLYSIYILDLCIIMPAFLIISYNLIKNKPFGLVFTPIIFILGFLVILPLAIADIIKPYFNANPGTGDFLPALILSGAFLVAAIIHLRSLKVDKVSDKSLH